MKVYGCRVTSGLKIKDVADATGSPQPRCVTTSRSGCLPEATRTAAGYRTYDQRTVDRLAFIARAKQLGCTLEEITGLSTAWDGGECGPIQDQLRHLVASKVAAAQSRIAELMTFTAELQRAATVLERHRPDGACDDTCGCVSEPADHAVATQAVRLWTPVSMTQRR
jgi:MerR family transcriptional regulator, copper efflux regulator